MCLLVILSGLPAWLCLAAPMAFLGREHAQAEYRWIKTFGNGIRANLPWWGAFDPRVWDVHSWWWNLLLPWLIASAFFAALAFR